MEVNVSGKLANSDPIADNLIEFLKQNVQQFQLEEAQLYYDFPVLRDLDGLVIRARILLVSRRHGVLVIAVSDLTDRREVRLEQELLKTNSEIDQVYSLLLSRLMRNPALRRSRGTLAFPVEGLLFAPFLNYPQPSLSIEFLDYPKLRDYLENLDNEITPPEIYSELVATIEGAKGIVRPRTRHIQDTNVHSKGNIANKIESEVNSFDERQKHGAISVLDGFQRIRGLAGSGKTVVLAMKAAQMHLRYPEADIAFTFYTKSLYQCVFRTKLGHCSGVKLGQPNGAKWATT